MSTSACGEGGPNGAVGGLDDTSAPGAGECGAGKAHCKRYRRLAANGDFTGLAFVAAVESCMSVEGRSAATPAASTATWDVVESSKPNSSLAVTAVGENGIRIAGLAAGHVHADHMGEYTRQADPEAGELWYKGGRDGDSAVWWHSARRTR